MRCLVRTVVVVVVIAGTKDTAEGRRRGMVAEGADVGEVKFVVWQARESVLRPEDRRWLIFCTQPRYEERHSCTYRIVCGTGSADGDRGARPVMVGYNFEIPAFGLTNGSSSYSEPESTPCPNAHITHHTRTTTRSAIFNNKHTECRLLNSRKPPRRSFPVRKQVDVPGQQLHQTPY